MSPLERRYRRLLRLYPASHRAQREDEIVGVMLDVARPGQRVPTVRDVVDLVAGAAAAHRHLPRSIAARARWSDASALAAVAGLAVLVLLAARTGASAARIARSVPDGWGIGPTFDVLSASHPTWRVDLLWIAVAIVAVAGAGRIASATAVGATVLHGVVLVHLAGTVNDDLVVRNARSLLLGVVVTVLLLPDARRVRRGVDLLRRPRRLGRGVLARLGVVAATGTTLLVGAAVAADAVRAGQYSSGWGALDLAPALAAPIAAFAAGAAVVRSVERAPAR